MKTKKVTLLSILLIAVMLFSSCATGSKPPDTTPAAALNADVQNTPQAATGELKISYLDVGQADSIYMILPNGETVLIDAGEQSSSEDVIAYIKSSGKTTLDYVVATHPHADHIGGMAAVLSAFDVKHVYMPDKTHTSKTFEHLIDTIDEKGLAIDIAKAGKTIFDYGNVKAEFIAPNADRYPDLNNYSAVVLLTYNDCRFLFMGDAEAESEAEIMTAGYAITADILKVGHHGSHSSSSEAFIQKVQPRYAVISCGEGNSYGHPHDDTLATLNKFYAEIYRTDTHGTVVATCDGETISLNSLKTEIQPRAPAPVPAAAATPKETNETSAQAQEQSATVYITRTGAKYHKEGCRYLSKSKIAISLDEAKKQCDPCSVCNPPQ